MSAKVDTEWKWVAGFALATASVYALTGTQLTLGHAGLALGSVPCLAGVTATYRYVRPGPRIADFTSTFLKLFVIGTLSLLITYPAATLGRHFAFRDNWLASADAFIGFDWQAYFNFITSHPILNAALRYAYLTLPEQFYVVGIALVATRQRRRLKVYILALCVTLTTTIAVFIFMPAHAHGVGAWFEKFDYMRSAGSHVLSFDDLSGIITFPSFHTQAAIMFIWACWKTPYLRWPVLLVNLALIAATPVAGQHYGVDVLAGASLAIAVLVGLNKFTKE